MTEFESFDTFVRSIVPADEVEAFTRWVVEGMGVTLETVAKSQIEILYLEWLEEEAP